MSVCNVLLEAWNGPAGGVPPFDRVEVAQIAPAVEIAIQQKLDEIEVIAAHPDPPDFENTLAALERSGEMLERVSAVYAVWSGTMSDEPFRAVERKVEPRLAALSDRINQNEALFRRIESVYLSADEAGLAPEERRLAWLYYTNFVRAGARLDQAGKERLSVINQRLATQFTRFGQNVLGDEDANFVVLEREDDLDGLPDSLVAATRTAAEAREMEGRWLVQNTRSAVDPFLTYSTRRDLRREVWEMWTRRGDHPGERDNKPLITEILALRAERAALLGYQTHAHWRLEHQMAKTPETAMALLDAVWRPAVARARQEIAEMHAAMDPSDGGSIAPWDYRFFMERVRLAKYDLDHNELRPYLHLETLREGMFWVANRLFDITFEEADDVPVYHPDVRVWKVYGREGGQPIGLWYFDPFARQGKRSGAWMSSYRRQRHLDGGLPALISNNANFVAAAPGESQLLSWDDAETLLHEFGHALHGLLSDVTYPSLSGTAVPRDFVEFPSQLFERWLTTDEFLQRFALHHRTGESMPRNLVDKIKATTTFRQGFDTVEFVSSAIVDLRFHLAGGVPIDPVAFERDTLATIGIPGEINMRHRPPHFMHVFSSDGYAASYYSYLWADVLTADGFDAFLEREGPYDSSIAQRLLSSVLSRGNTVDPAESYRAFRGRDASVEALMRQRGFASASSRTSAT